MNIRELQLFGFLSYTNETIHFDKEGVYLIVGEDKITKKSNGTGKSSIADGIAFVLHGVSREGEKSADAMIKVGTDKMFIKLKFTMNNDTYNILRSKTLKNSSIKISKNDKDLGLKIRDAQDYINKLLGADYKIFRNTAYFKQGDMDAFSKLTPREAKELLIKILQLDVYNDYEAKAKDKVTELNYKLIDLESRINTNTELLADQTLKEKTIDTESINKDLIIYEKELQNMKENQIRIKAEIDGLNDRYNEIEQKKQNIKGLQTPIIKKLTKLKEIKNVCPLCLSKLSKDKIDLLKKDLNLQSADLSEEFNKLNKQSQEYANKEVIVFKKVSPVETKIAKLQTLVTDSKVQLAKRQAELKEQKERTTKFNKLKAEIKFDKDKFKALETETNKYRILASAFGKNGIQAYIIDNMIPEIETTANNLLYNLEGTLKLIFDTQKKLKSGKTAETLDIRILDIKNQRIRPYYNYSGGEKTLIDFVLRIALSVVLSRRANSQISTLILDECFNQLDSIGRQAMSRAIHYIAHQFGFKKVLVISHTEEIQEHCDNIIKVIKDNTGSHIKNE